MFDAEIRATFAAQAKAMADQVNSSAAEDYLMACANWAKNRGAGPAPQPQNAVLSTVSFEGYFTLQLVDAGYPVSTVKPESFLPTFPTDEGAVGGPVGGPIPGQGGKWYRASGSTDTKPYTAPDGRQFEFRAPFFGIGGYWVQV